MFERLLSILANFATVIALIFELWHFYRKHMPDNIRADDVAEYEEGR